MFTARERPGTSLESEKVVDTSSTKLFISHVKVSDSGNYSCISDIARPASVQLVVSVWTSGTGPAPADTRQSSVSHRGDNTTDFNTNLFSLYFISHKEFFV